MTIQIDGVGHVFLFVEDDVRTREFYTDVLGLKVLAQEGDGGCFLTTGGGGDATHVVDFAKIPEIDPSMLPEGYPMPTIGIGHVAFKTGSHEALRDAYFALVDRGVNVTAIDHETQESIYFQDPDQITVEIYWERPGAKKLWAQGRNDTDKPLEFER